MVLDPKSKDFPPNPVVRGAAVLTAVGRGNVFPLESPTAETSDLDSGLDVAEVAKENCVAPPRILVLVAELAKTTDDGADVPPAAAPPPPFLLAI